MSLGFSHVDTFMDDVLAYKEVQDVAEFLCQNIRHNELIVKAADGILRSKGPGEFRHWMSNLLADIGLTERAKKDRRLLGKLAELLDAVYSLCLQAHPALSQEEERERLGKLRGAVLEAFVGQVLRLRYSTVETGCSVELNGSRISPRTFDVAGVDNPGDPAQGELYECKVGAYFIERHDLENIEETLRQLREAKLAGVLASIVSFETKYDLLPRFKKLRFPNQKVIDRNKLKCLATYEEVSAVLAS
ncbi:MAG: hypothetical protein AB1700_19675 [Bacillota bacterium]